MMSPETRVELEKLVSAGAFVPLEGALPSPVFVIPKRTGGVRLIHDLRQVNACLRPPTFTLRGAAEAADVVRRSSWLVALDLRHGYQQVAMAPEARQFLGADMGEGRTVAATVLPFGLSLSPYVFTRLTGFLARLVRRRVGLEVAVYVDDFLLGGESEEKVVRGLEEVRDLFGRLGVVLSDKIPAVPAQQADFLGFRWDAVAKEVQVPEERRREYRREVKNLLRSPQPRARWRATVGRLLFLREACPTTMRHLRPILHLLQSRGVGGRIEAVGEAREDLQWWADALASPLAMSLVVRPVTASLTTDASDASVGFSVVVGSQRVEDTQPAHDHRQGINSKELEAVLKGLESGGELLRGRRVVLYTDNMTARAAVARQGTQQLSSRAWELSKAIVDKAQALGVELLPRHVPGRLNSHADALSRPGEERDAWGEALRLIIEAWGPLEEDPFGFTGAPTCLLEGCEWAGRRSLLRPPVSQVTSLMGLLGSMVTRAPEGPPSTWKSAAVLVVPFWRGATWWGQVERWAWGGPLMLGTLPDTHLSRWRERNGHMPRWCAWLLPTCLPSQRDRPGRRSREPSSVG